MLSSVSKRLRPRLLERYGERLEQMYEGLERKQHADLVALRDDLRRAAQDAETLMIRGDPLFRSKAYDISIDFDQFRADQNAMRREKDGPGPCSIGDRHAGCFIPAGPEPACRGRRARALES